MRELSITFAFKCWKKFPRRGFRCIINFSNCARAFRMRNFLVEDGMLALRQPAAFDDPELILRAFRFLARHGLHA